MNTFKIFAVLFFALAPGLASAHQPRIVDSRQTTVVSPEVSKAYYGQLTGEPDTFTIQADTPFALYVNILIPDIATQKKDVSVTITKNGKMIAAYDGMQFEWRKMFEPFGYDKYWAGPEFKENVEAGTYVMKVSSPSNDGKYALAIGEAEKFDFKETLNAITLIPKLKKNFFNESPINFILSPFGWGLIVVLYILAVLFGLAYRFILRKFTPNTARGVAKNIGTRDRVLRFGLGVALLLWAITTSWSPVLIFFSGFTLFEAFFSWCGFYAALGRNTCPIE